MGPNYYFTPALIGKNCHTTLFLTCFRDAPRRFLVRFSVVFPRSYPCLGVSIQDSTILVLWCLLGVHGQA